MTKQDKKNKMDEFIHVGMVSSYLMLIEDRTYGDVRKLQQEKGVKSVFFLSPMDIDTGDIQKCDLESMIEHFVEQEDYKKCAKIKWLIDNNKCDEDGWLFLTNRLNTN